MSAQTTLSSRQLNHFARVLYLVVALWVLTMISLPIVRWVFGDDALPIGITLGVLIQFTAVITSLIYGWGVIRSAAVIAIVLTLGWAVEYIGHRTGFPFGSYVYTDLLQPQIGGVPVLIPLAWMMMMPPAWAVAYAITHRLAGIRRAAAYVVTAMLAFTAWDLFLDPQMVAWGLWVWDDPGPASYFGIPWSNYAGWLLAAGIMTLATLPLQRPERLPLRPLLIIYGLTWALQTIGLLVFWGMPGPALAGFIGMGVFVGLAVRAARAQRAAS